MDGNQPADTRAVEQAGTGEIEHQARASRFGQAAPRAVVKGAHRRPERYISMHIENRNGTILPAQNGHCHAVCFSIFTMIMVRRDDPALVLFNLALAWDDGMDA